MSRWIRRFAAALRAPCMTGAVDAQTFPERDIRIIHAGNAHEIPAGITAEGFSTSLGKRVIPERSHRR